MKYLSLTNDNDRLFIKGLMRNNSLIPIVGAGFTRNCKAKKGYVPDANGFKSMMINSVLDSSEKFRDKRAELEKKNFFKVAEYYLRFVDQDIIKKHVGDCFVGVVLSNEKKSFLEIDWPYIYTLNIDDGIENTGIYKPLLPYKKISERSVGFKRVYKLHGCAAHEVMYDEPSSLIFSSSQYIRSLIKNESMLLALRNDYYEKNFIYIGCSLTDEVDLMYALSGVDEISLNNNSRIYVTRNRPDELSEIDLDSYGIDRILLVEDYDTFYSDICDLYKELIVNSDEYMNAFAMVKRSILNKDKDLNINYLLRADASLMSKGPVLPYYHISRTVKGDVLGSIDDNVVTVIRGRRFSGKTLLLIDIATSVKDRDVYYFDSRMSLSEYFFAGILNRPHALYLFDSNVLDYDMARMLRSKITVLKSKDIRIVVCCNSFEQDVVGVFLTATEYGYVEIQNKYDEKEVALINGRLSELGVVNWDGSKNILDNIYRYSEFYKDKKSNVVCLTALDYDEMKLLFVLSVFDKVYSVVIRAMGMKVDSVDNMVKKMSPLLEKEVTSFVEAHQHSAYKVVVNSKLWVSWYANQYYRRNGVERINALIIDLVRALDPYNEYRYVIKKIVMFDNLNQLFGGNHGGVAHLIFALYENLQDIMYADPDYWLQRAKAILKINDSTVEDVLNGIDYAKKAFQDGRRDKTVDNAEFTIALLYGKLCFMTKYSDVTYVFEAIDWFHDAISNQYSNREYIESMLEASKGRRGYFYYLCKYLAAGSLNSKMLIKREEVQFLLNYSFRE